MDLDGFRLSILMINLIDFPNLPHVQFIKKESHEFIKNRKYIQVCKQYPNGYTIFHIVIYREDKNQGEEYLDNSTYISFSLYKEIQRYKTNDIPKCIYYEIISKKKEIQDAMELRALNKIIQHIIGDKYFEYK